MNTLYGWLFTLITGSKRVRAEALGSLSHGPVRRLHNDGLKGGELSGRNKRGVTVCFHPSAMSRRSLRRTQEDKAYYSRSEIHA
jgi:hypothetical protein